MHTIRTDRGHEFQSRFHWHVEDKGIRHVYIKPRPPQLNGKVERSHRSDQEEFYQLLDIENARDNGTIIAGGELPDGPGYFVPLTVVRDIEDGTAVVDEEPFGPILPIIKYRDIDDAIARANNSEYRLGGSVWSSDIERAWK